MSYMLQISAFTLKIRWVGEGFLEAFLPGHRFPSYSFSVRGLSSYHPMSF